MNLTSLLDRKQYIESMLLAYDGEDTREEDKPFTPKEEVKNIRKQLRAEIYHTLQMIEAEKQKYTDIFEALDCCNAKLKELEEKRMWVDKDAINHRERRLEKIDTLIWGVRSLLYQLDCGMMDAGSAKWNCERVDEHF